jgi:hypothetical protein
MKKWIQVSVSPRNLEQKTLDSVFMNHERVVVRYVAGLVSLKSTILFSFP